MKSTEFLKDIINLFAKASQDEQKTTDGSLTSTDSTDDASVGIFMPPLQQKIELLKRAVDVDNVYSNDPDKIASSDYECEEESTAEEDSDIQLRDIKRMAGINPVALDSLVDDDPLEA